MSGRPALAIVVAVLLAGPARAAGPLIVNGPGEPLVWTAAAIPFNPDRGTLGALDNAAAVADVAANFAVWQAVPTAQVAFVDAGPLPVDVKKGNYASYAGVCGDGLSPIVFDTDGTITDDVFGAGASASVLGFAGPDCGTYAPPVISEGVAVLNGKWIDGTSSAGNGEISRAEFNAVFVHEFGHYLNLDHSQIGLAEAFDDDAGNDGRVATMFPFLVDGAAATTLALDDEVAVSTLYPAPGFASGRGTIRGRILRPDGVTPFQGAFVVARRLGDPLITAVGGVSGARWAPGSPGGAAPAALTGLFELPGLPPGDYTVEVEPIHPAFVGGSGVGPLSPPPSLPGPPEFWNGADEAGTGPPDDPTAAVPIAVAAGATVDAIDIRLNQPAPPVHDDCAAPVTIAATPFFDVRTTAAATSAPGDPQPSCTPSANANTVWYAYTPPVGGTVTLDTAGSSYDTVLTVYTGGCGTPVEAACSDDVAGGQLSKLSFIAAAGTTYLVEVADYGSPGGGTLFFRADFSTCGNGTLEAGESCDLGAANGQGACCTTACALVDADGDAVCDAHDGCPAAADPAQTDADGDGRGDACDACVTAVAGQTAWLKPKLTVRGLSDGRTGNDTLLLTGQFRLATGAFTVDPRADGATVELRSADGFPLWSVALPPGAGGPDVPGWRFAKGAVTYVDARPGGTGGVSRMVVRDRGAGLVEVLVSARRTTFGFDAGDAPFALTIVPGGAAAGAAGECGELTFGSPPAEPACAATGRGAKVTCR